MPGGRPAKGQERHEVFEPLAAWFDQSLESAGYSGVNEFLTANRLLNTDLVHGLENATRPLKLDEIRMIALALKRPLEEAEALWRETRDEVERRTAENRRAEALSSWDDVPSLLDPSVQDLMESQRDLVDQLPYQQLMVEPPALSEVYVRQQVRHEIRSASPEAPDKPESRPAPETVTALDALNRHEHVLLTGEPGTGKSTFGLFVTGLLARRWLSADEGSPAVDEPVLPLRIPARELTGTGTWSEVVANAVDRMLGLHLTGPCPPGLLAGRVHGARWLLVIDGLDEITDSAARKRLIAAVARHAKSGESYRFVVGTRDLPQAELAPLRNGRFGDYVMAAFSRPDLADFADRWFLAQDPVGGRVRAERFLHQVTGGRLREIVRNPLLATICAIVHTKEPGRPLPANRVELYERFYRYLVGEEYSGRERRDDRLRGHREDLIEHLGRTRLKGDTSLLAAAVAWVKTWLPDEHVNEETVQATLVSTGLFVREGRDLRFLHHSFAEYLSAKGVAAGLTVDGPAMAELLRKWRDDGPEADHIVFTLTLWARRAGNDLSALVSGGRWQNPSLTTLAGRLLAEGVALGDDVAAGIVERLGALALAKGKEFEVLADMCENRIAGDYLLGIAGAAELAVPARVRAAVALCRVRGLSRTREILDELRGLATAPDQIAIGRVMIDLLPNTRRDEAVGVLCRAGATDLRAACDAASILHQNGESRRAAKLLDAVLCERPRELFRLDIVADVWLSVHGGDKVRDLLALASTARDRTSLATVLIAHGHIAPARELVSSVLSDENADAFTLGLAVGAWRRIEPGLTSADLRTALVTLGGLTADKRVQLAGPLNDAQFADMAHELLRSALNGVLDVWEADILARVWVAVSGPDGVRELVNAAKERSRDIAMVVGFADGLSASEANAEALAIVDFVTRHRMSELNEKALAALVRAWHRSTDGRAAQDISRLLADRAASFGASFLLIYLRRSALPVNTELARRVLTERPALGFDLAAEILLTEEGDDAVDEILASVTNPARLPEALADVIRALVALGNPAPARELFARLVAHPGCSPTLVNELSLLLLGVGQREAILGVLRRLLTDPKVPERQRVPIRAVLAWLTLLHPDATTCGVPTCTGHRDD